MVGIYKITNTENGKIYIGQSVDIGHRKACHEYDLKNGRHHNCHLQRAYNQNPSVFRFEIICKCKEEELNDLEIFFIKNHSFHIETSKNRPVGCLFVPEGGLLFLPPMNPASQALGKADIEDLFSGVFSMELGPRPETQLHRGRKTTWTSLCSPGDL